MQHRHGKFIWVLLVVGLYTLLAGAAPAAEFSATIVATIGGQERQGKIYVKGDKIRREYTNPAGTTIFIIPGDQPIMWMFEPQIPTYTELPYDKDAFSKKLNLQGRGWQQAGGHRDAARLCHRQIRNCGKNPYGHPARHHVVF